MKIILGTICTLMLLSCTVQSDIDPDGGMSSPDVYVPIRECVIENVQNDFFHCGRCDSVCPANDSDRCVAGVCRCGIHETCAPGQDCRVGFCIDSDINGEGCEFDHECEPGDACIEGHCSFVSCFPEVCDGVDNDCDGTIDGTQMSPLSEWCHQGVEVDPLVIVEPCTAGVRVCEGGVWSECFGSVEPLSELGTAACNNRDDDCDGCVDGNMVDGVCERIVTDGFDIVFFLDPSSSMSAEHDAVVEAVTEFATIFNREDFRFAIITMPGDIDGEPQLYQDFTDYGGFLASLSGFSMDSDLRSRGKEPTYDALYHAGRRDFGLSYGTRTIKIYIMFTDEGGQSFMAPQISESQACSQLANGEVFVVFESRFHWDEFDCADSFFELENDSVSMAANLASVIQDPCL